MKKIIKFLSIVFVLFFISLYIISCTTGTNATVTPPTTTSNLVLYYTFDEGSGATINDYSASNIYGTIIDGTWVTGRSGHAVYFDGTNDYIQIRGLNQSAPTEIAGLSEGTISIWFKFEDEGGGLFLPLFYIGPNTDDTATHAGTIIEIGHTPLRVASREIFYTVTLGNGDPTLCFDSGYNLTAGQWYHYAVTVSSTAGNVGYINGEEIAGRVYNFGNNAMRYFLSDVTGGMFTLGYGRSAINGQFYHFKGTIDELRVYNKALSAAEIQQIYNGN